MLTQKKKTPAMNSPLRFCALVIYLVAAFGSDAAVLRVPADYATIGAAIDAASHTNIDTILVSPGTYVLNYELVGKSVRLLSSDGPGATVITSSAASSANGILDDGIIAVENSEHSLVAGFTFSNLDVGIDCDETDGPGFMAESNVFMQCNVGVLVEINAFATVSSNLFTSCGTGIELVSSACTADHNLIVSDGTGISITDPHWFGGAIQVFDNTIRDNRGDGIDNEQAGAEISQNLICSNGGYGVLNTGLGPASQIVNNTIAGNALAGVCLTNADTVLANNIIVGDPVLSLLAGTGQGSNNIDHNDLFSPPGANGSVLFTNSGNISVDPVFRCPQAGDYHLASYSPCVDAGDTNEVLETEDFDGRPRVLAGETNGTPIVDMGAFEFDPDDPGNVCLYIACPSDIAIAYPTNGNPVTLNFPPPKAPRGAVVTCTPPSGSVFPLGETVVHCSAVQGSNEADCSFNVIVGLPVITQPLPNLVVNFGDNPAVSIGVMAEGPISYTWFYNGIQIPCGCGNQLSLGTVLSDCFLQVIATSEFGSVTSSVATVRVLPAPPVCFFDEPVQTVMAGSSLDLTVDTGYDLEESMDDQFQWWHHGKVVSDFFPENNYHIADAQAQDAGVYTVVVQNEFGSNTAQVLVKVRPQKPQWQQPPEDSAVTAGQSTELTALAYGTEPIHYQWSLNGSPLAGGANGTLPIHASGQSAGLYRVVARNACGAVAASARLTVDRGPVIAPLAQRRLAAAGSSFVLQPRAAGTGPLSYLWTFNFSALDSDTGPSLRFSNFQLPQTGLYGLIVFGPLEAAFAKEYLIGCAPPSAVLGWGDDSGNQIDSPAGLKNVIALAGGSFHTVALRANGTVAAWGLPHSPGLNVPRALSGVVAVAAGGNHSLALTARGRVICWGENSAGQCTPPEDLDNVVAIAAGAAHSVALDIYNSVSLWGDNFYGQASATNVYSPTAIGAGAWHTLFVNYDGTVAAVGLDNAGQCNPPPEATNAIAVAGGYLHSMALRSDGTVVCWGDNSAGQSSPPPGLSNVVQIAAGAFHSMALQADGTVVCWGDNSYGQINPPANPKAAFIGAGYYHSLALAPTQSSP